MIELIRSTRRLAPALALVAALAACDDATAPAGELDVAAAAEAVASMVDATEDLGHAFGSMAWAGTLFEAEGTAQMVARGPALDAATARRFLEAPRTEAFFPSNYLGVTFEYSDAEDRYMPTALEGAPEDGIRILYYAVDPFTHEPQVGSPLGYIDLRDLSGAASNRLGVLVVNTAGDADITFADYYVDVAWSMTETSIGADMESIGFLSNGETQLDFDLAQALRLSENQIEVSQDYGMGLHGSDLSVRYVAELVGDPATEQGTLDLEITVTNDGGILTFDVAVSENALDGTVTSGGAVVAYIGGTPDAPEFTDVDGNAVDPAEIEALEQLFAAAQSLFELAAGIFGPAQ